MTHRRTTTDWPHDLRSNFRESRRRLGLRQSDIARLAGVPQPRISRWERNKLDLTLTAVTNLYTALALLPGRSDRT